MYILNHPDLDAEGNIVTVTLRDDGFVNVTKICRDVNKNLQLFTRNREIDKNLVTTSSIAADRGGGTWMHFSLAYDLAKWISDDYAAKFVEIFYKAYLQNRDDLQKLRKKNLEQDALVREIERTKAEIERMKASDQIIQENEQLRQENVRLKEKTKEAVERYDKEIGYKHRWENYEQNYKTAYQYVRDKYGIDMTESTYKNVEKEMVKRWKKKNAESNIQHNLRTAWERYNLEVAHVRPLNPEIVKPEFPEPPKHFKKITPRVINSYHRRDWHLIDDLYDMFKNDPPWNPLGCRDVSMYDFEKGKVIE